MSDKNRIKSLLQDVIDERVASGYVAGMNVLVLQDGKELAYVESGMADIDSKKPFHRDAILRIYSMSKPITAAAVMILLEKNLISLGERVEKYLPGFKDLQVWEDDENHKPAYRPVYIKDLLCMTSGLPYGDSNGHGAFKRAQNVFDAIDRRLYTDDQMSTVEIANALGEAGLVFSPGARWMYGTSADILGAIVEVASGMSYGEFLKKELFDPLEMKDTGFSVPEKKRKRLASVYERKGGKLTLFETNHLGMRYMRDCEPAFESGGAGLTSTIDDYAHFATMLMSGGTYKGKRVLSEHTVRYMTSGRLTPWQEESLWRDWDGHGGYSYGCLMQHMINPGMAYFHTCQDEYGWDGWLGTYFCNCPKERVTILCGMQITDEEGNLVFERVRNALGQYIG